MVYKNIIYFYFFTHEGMTPLWRGSFFAGSILYFHIFREHIAEDHCDDKDYSDHIFAEDILYDLWKNSPYFLLCSCCEPDAYSQ